jgi:DNA-binding GntR family transcriptional regulator
MDGSVVLTLHDRISGELRDLIVEGALAPGSRLNERELCARFGISRTPLREALKVLAREGLVDLLPNRGARVARLEAKDVADMFDVMGALEALAGKLAAPRITETELHEIRALHYEMLAAHARRDLPAYFRRNQAIHEAILAAARNPVLSMTYHGLAGRIRRARYVANMTVERWDAAVAEHETILSALAARDGAHLSSILAEHLDHKRTVVEASLAGETTPEESAA